jgi:hypothetical protein
MNGTEVEVPVFVTGFVSRFDVDPCMDGSTHLLHHWIGATRLKATNDEAQRQLEHFEGRQVTVAGYARGKAHCTRIDVYHVHETAGMVETLYGRESL